LEKVHIDRHLAALAVILLVVLAALLPSVLTAQSQSSADNGVQVGDRWTFDSRDEITGLPGESFTRVVTEVSPNEIILREATRGQSGFGVVVYDRNWNRTENATFKWKPNDGRGIQSPLAVGKEWRYGLEERNTKTGNAWKVTLLSKVTAQETIKVAGGTFDTFKIETRHHDVSATDPSKTWDYEIVGWYAPQVNYWVRRNFVTKVQKRTTETTSQELTDFGRKP